jgi:superfamily II DNA helicase RecQ
MKIRIFTLPFDVGSERFPDEVVTHFCASRKVHSLKSEFFSEGSRFFWTVAVQYEPIDSDNPQLHFKDLDEHQQALYKLLSDWRKEIALKEGFPAYLVCNNKQLVKIIQERCTTLDELSRIRGFGKAKLQKYGKAITQIIKQFYGAKKTP